MPLPLEEQYKTALSAWSTGDIDLIEKVLTNPGSITPSEHRSLADTLGLRNAFARAAVDVVGDPLNWVLMLLSRRAPTTSFWNDTVPHRMIGASKEFSGASLAFRPSESFFRSTLIPRHQAVVLKRMTAVRQLGEDLYQKLIRRPHWDAEMPIVSQLMEGQPVAGATHELRDLAIQSRSVMDQMYQFLVQAHKVQGGFTDHGIFRASAEPLQPQEVPRYLRDYLPHMPILNSEATFEYNGPDALRRMGTNSTSAQLLAATGQASSLPWKNTGSRLQSDYVKYQDWLNQVGAQILNPRMFKRIRHGIPLASERGQEIFITDLNVVLPRYFESVARTYALNAPLTPAEQAFVSRNFEQADGSIRRRYATAEPPIVQIINEGLDDMGVQWEELSVAGTNRKVHKAIDPPVPAMLALRNLVRETKGQLSEDKLLFNRLNNKIFNAIENGLDRVSRRDKNQIAAAVDHASRNRAGRRWMNSLTTFLYGNTVGINTRANLVNLMQPFLTTANAIGLGPTIKGYRTLGSRLPGYFREFGTQYRSLRGSPIRAVEKIQIAQEQAFERTFPELHRQGIRSDPRLFEQTAEELAEGGRFKTFDDYSRFLMLPFSQTEMVNQIVTFYGGRHALQHAIKTGEYELPTRQDGTPLTPQEQMEYIDSDASMLVSATQFRPGPGSKTVMQSLLPAPFRMFTSFPIRLFNFFAQSTVNGALLNRQLEQASLLEKITRGRNLSTLARTILTGNIIATGVRETLGVDLSSALGITGPFNINPTEREIVGLPTPPLVSVAMGLVSSAATRDIKQMQPLTLPGVGDVPIPKVLFPGGIQINRVVNALNQFRPDIGGFIDNAERLKYRGDTTDLILKALGLPAEKDRRLNQAIDISKSNTLRIRQLRRQLAVANHLGDMQAAEQAMQAYAKEFPDLHRMQPLAVSPKDQARYEAEQRITTGERVLRAAGTDYETLYRPELFMQDPDLVSEESLP